MSSSPLNKSLTTVARGATIVFAGLTAGYFLGMLNQVLLGRFLGPENYGLFNIAISVIEILLAFSVFGIFNTLSRFIPYNLEDGNRDTIRSVIDFSMAFVLTTSIIAAIVLFVLSGRIASGIFHDHRLEPLLKLFATGLPVVGLHRVASGAIRGFKSVKYDALLFKIAIRLIKISVFLLLVVVGYRIYGAVIAFYAGTAVTLIISIWLIRSKIFPGYKGYSRVPVARQILSFTWPLALTGFTYLFVTKTDTVLLGYFLSSGDVGIYTPALVISRLLNFVGAAFIFIFLPVVSQLFARGNIGDLESLFKSTSKWMFFLVLPLLLLVLVFPREILRILYGPEYLSGYTALIILASSVTMNTFLGLSGNILVGGGYTRLNLTGEIIAAVCNISLNIVLIPIYGIVGAAVATGISYLARNIAFLVFVYRILGIHPYKRSYLNIFLSGVGGMMLIYILKIYSPLPWLPTMLILSLIFVFIYILSVLLSRSLDENDMVVLGAVERKLGISLDFIKKYTQ